MSPSGSSGSDWRHQANGEATVERIITSSTVALNDIKHLALIRLNLPVFCPPYTVRGSSHGVPAAALWLLGCPHGHDLFLGKAHTLARGAGCRHKLVAWAHASSGYAPPDNRATRSLRNAVASVGL